MWLNMNVWGVSVYFQPLIPLSLQFTILTVIIVICIVITYKVLNIECHHSLDIIMS